MMTGTSFSEAATVYGAVCLILMTIVGAVLVFVTVYDWLCDRAAARRDRNGASEQDLIAQLEAIPTPGPWETT